MSLRDPDLTARPQLSDQSPHALRTVLVSFVRTPLLLLLFGAVLAVSAVLGVQNAVGTYNGYVDLLVVLVDLATLGLLAWLLRREGETLRGLFDLGRSAVNRSRLGRDVLYGLGLAVPLAVVFQLASFASVAAVVAVIGGTSQPAMVPRPTWVGVSVVLVSAATIAFAEEGLYRGYALPRIEAATGSPWVAVVATSAAFGLQHALLPVADPQWMLARVLGTFIVGLFLGALYVRWRRLLPLVVAHWAIDVAFLGLLPLLFPAGG